MTDNKDATLQNEKDHASPVVASECMTELKREKQKNRSLFFIIGGVICFEVGRLLQDFHEVFAMIGSVVAVILSIYGIFHYFEAYSLYSKVRGEKVKPEQRENLGKED